MLRDSRHSRMGPRGFSRAAGMTMLELIIACSILLILSSMALPMLRFSAIRAREGELRKDLQNMREAIDRYHEMAQQHKFRTAVASDNYPPDLDELVKGEELSAVGSSSSSGERLIFLKRIPVDPMTGKADWGLRCTSDDYDSTSWCGNNVFDVYSKSTTTGMNGTKYSDW
jgi:general secretion pathway protein G